MLENMIRFNKVCTDWQLAQMKLAGTTAQTHLTQSLTAWQSSANLAAAVQQDVLASFKPASK